MAKVLIIGAARSGLAAAAFLAQKGEEVVVTDTNIKAQSESEDALKNYDIRYIWGKQPDIDELNLDLIVVSPGVPLNIAPIVRAKELGIPVTGEVELAYLNAKAPIVAITGTNGKTTTTTLVGEIFKASGRECGFHTCLSLHLQRSLQVTSLEIPLLHLSKLVSSIRAESVHEFRCCVRT